MADYGHKHRTERARWAPVVDAGNAYCTEAVCLESDRWLEPGMPWDLAHDRTTGGYRGPAHQLCNRSEGAKHRDNKGPTTWDW